MGKYVVAEKSSNEEFKYHNQYGVIEHARQMARDVGHEEEADRILFYHEAVEYLDMYDFIAYEE